MSVDVRLLGPTEVVIDGRPVELGGGRQRRLLTALALEAGAVVSADRLIDRVWSGEDLPANPRAALRTYLTRLRQALGDEYSVVTDAAGWRLDNARVSVDIRRFEELVDTASEPGLDVHDRLAHLDRALQLWRGEALEQVTDDDWARAEIDRLDELRLVATERRYEAMLAAGMHTDALPGLTGEREQNPFRDRLVGLQMLALYRSGRQAEATRVFQSHRARLGDELGLEPSQELIDLDRRVLEADPTLQVGPVGGRALRGYRLGEQLGEGAFAVVYRGTQPSVGRDVAVKIIRSELANRPEFIRRFEAEAHLVARLEHPHIVPLYDYWREPDRACLVLRYLRGGTLEASLTSTGGLTSEAASRLVEQVAGGLSVAHRAGVVHRDVKPANIFLDDTGNYYLGDFGIALEATELADPTAALSAGSPAYASPEQLRREPIGPSADIHALAITAYEALTVRLPFPEATSHADLLQRQLNDPIPAVARLRPEIPAAVDEVLARATAKDPSARYQSVEAFAEEFVGALDARPVDDDPTTNGRRGVATALSLTDARNPFKGLRAFTEADAGDFRGRERLVDRLVELLGQGDTSGRIAAVVGPSGIGKSSIVRAGLLPALRRGRVPGSEEWFVATMLPGRDPFDELAAALLRVATRVPDNLMTVLDQDHRGLARAVKAIVPEDSVAEVLLLIDQFEELFTLVEDDGRRQRFLDAMEYALTDVRCPLRIVLTMRADFWDRPLRHGAFARLIEHSVVNVTALAPDELERAIVEPANATGCEFEPGLVSEIVADVADEPGALPLLQYALTELWERRISGLLTRDAYRELGGVAGALARRAEELYEEAEDSERPLLRRVFGRLVSLGEGTEDTRRRALRSELTTGVGAAEVIDRFGQARLLSFDRDPATREPTVEVAHEALLREWPRLRTWLEEDRDGLRLMRHLDGVADEWDSSGRPESELYRGGRLEAAEEHARANPDDLTPLEGDFITASTELREREEAAERARFDQQVRNNRRLRTLLTGVGVLLVLALIAGGLAFQQRNRADANAAATETERIAADAVARAGDNRQLALLLAAESYRRDPGPVALGSLQKVLTATGPYLGVVGAGQSFAAAAWLDERRVAAAGSSGVAVFDIETGEQLLAVDLVVAVRAVDIGLDDSVYLRPAAAFSSTTAVVATADGCCLAIVDLDDGTVTTIDEELVAPVEAIAMAESGEAFAVLDQTGGLDLYRFDDLAGPIWERDAYPEAGQGLGELYEGTGADFDGFIVGFDLAALAPPFQADLVFLEGGDEVATNQFGVIRYWDTLSGEPSRDQEHTLMESGDRAIPRRSYVVAADGEGLVTAGETFLRRDGEITEVPTTGPWFGLPNVAAVATLDDDLLIQFTDGRLAVVDGETVTLSGLEFSLGFANPGPMALDRGADRVAIPTASGVTIWSLQGQQLLAEAFPRRGATAGTVNRDGSRITANDAAYWFSPALDSPRSHIEVTTGVELPLPTAAGEYTYAYFADSHFLYSWGEDFRIRAYDPETLTALESLQQVGANGFTVSGAAGLSALGSGPGLQVFPLEGGPPIVDLEMEALASSLSFSADGSRLAATNATIGRVHIWDTTTWELIEDGTEIDTFVENVRYSPDGRYLVTVDDQGVFTLRGAESNEPLRRLLGSKAEVLDNDIWFSDDGRYMISGGFGVLRLWDLEAGVQLGGTFPNDPGFRIGGNDGPQLLTAVDDHLLVWNLDVESWPEIACRAAGRNLTVEEWEQFGPSDEAYAATCSMWPSLDT